MDNNRVIFSGGFFILFAFLLLIMPLQWVVAASFAAIFHELCHYLAIRLCTGHAVSLRIYAYAARIPLPEMSRGREVLCALAGPIGGLSLLLLARWMPRTAICGAMQSLYNLMPIYPLDGGRVLSGLLAILFPPPRAALIAQWISFLFKILVVILSLYAFLWLKLGIMPLLMAALILIRTK